MYWYILHVQTGREYNVEELLRKRLDSNIFMPFIPLQESLFKIAGTVKKELKPLFPGYVFVESELSEQEFMKRTSNLIYATHIIIRLLRYSDTEIALRECERQMLLCLSNDKYCIEPSSGIIKGDKIYITDGPLRGWESIVKKVNRHKRQASIEIEFMGSLRLVSVSLEIMDKV
ncbi:MAG: antiterminator LoaP [Clostridia bacterium]|nr:antiterminator LoaP [Clostridia bacterium]